MRNATLKTKGEGGQILGRVALLGSVWHPSAAAPFRRCQLFKPTRRLCQLSDSFLSLFLPLACLPLSFHHFSPPSPCLRFAPFAPSVHQPPRPPLYRFRLSYGCFPPWDLHEIWATGRWNKYFIQVLCNNNNNNKKSLLIARHISYCISLCFFFLPPIQAHCYASALYSGPKQNGGSSIDSRDRKKKIQKWKKNITF